MATAVDDASSEARYEDQGLRGFVKLSDEVDVGSQSADRGSMELAMEVLTAERTYSRAKRRDRYLKGLVCEASEALERIPQRSWRSK